MGFLLKANPRELYYGGPLILFEVNGDGRVLTMGATAWEGVDDLHVEAVLGKELGRYTFWNAHIGDAEGPYVCVSCVPYGAFYLASLTNSKAAVAVARTACYTRNSVRRVRESRC